jgi:anti-sigma B factor antagonist
MSSSGHDGGREPGAFHCVVLPDRERVVVVPVGELDLATTAELDRQVAELLESGFRHVVVDLAELSFLDSTGVHLLIRWSRRAADDGWTFEVTPGDGAVERVLDLTGVRGLLCATHRTSRTGGASGSGSAAPARRPR